MIYLVSQAGLHTSERVRVTLIPGDGVGPEMMDSCQEVLQSMGARLDFEPIYFSEVRILDHTITEERHNASLFRLITVPVSPLRR